MYPEATFLLTFALLTGLAMLLLRTFSTPARQGFARLTIPCYSSWFPDFMASRRLAVGHVTPAVPVDHGRLLTATGAMPTPATVTDPVTSRPGRLGGT